MRAGVFFQKERVCVKVLFINNSGRRAKRGSADGASEL